MPKEGALLAHLKETLLRCGLIPPGGSVLCALSGGPDSMALLCALRRLAPELGFSLCAAHFNHGMRPSAGADEAFCREWCRAQGVALFVGREDVPAFAKENRLTLEEGARQARYAFLFETAWRENCCRIAVAHHQADQAETVLYRLGRGSGLAGLCGMAVQNGALIRPMLFASREEILAFLKEEGIPFCRDETNEQPCCARNRLRLLSSALETVHEGFLKNTARAAELLKKDQEALEAWAESELRRREDQGALRLDGFDRLPEAIQSRVLRRCAASNGLKTGLEQRHIDALLALCKEESGCRSLPGNRRARLEGGRLFLENAGGASLKTDGEPCYVLSEGTFAFSSGTLRVRRIDRPENLREHWPLGCCVSPGSLSGAVIRCRKAGDKIAPLGAPGTKKLKDFFIDKKTEKARRAWPLVACGNDVLFAPGGGGFSRRAALRSGETEAVELRFFPAENGLPPEENFETNGQTVSKPDENNG